MKIPGPDHSITVELNTQRIKIMFNGRTIADTKKALELNEATLAPVQYIPREDVDLKALERTNHSTHCPYKGDAAYFSIAVDGAITENAVWRYESPYPAVAPIKDHLAFYPNKVDSIEVAAV